MVEEARKRRLETPVPTPYGAGRLVVAEAPVSAATLLLSHGAGKGIDAADLAALAEGLPPLGISVALFEQPWRVAGRKVASPPATLDVGLRAAAEVLATTSPLVVGGRSAGARSAARCAAHLGALGCLAISFPLHPPGRPEKSRLDELSGADVPTLVIQGGRDSMGRPEEFPRDLPGVEMVVVPDADHGLKVPARAGQPPAAALRLLVEAVWEWMDRVVVGNH